MASALIDYLGQDHARLDALLRAAVAQDGLDAEAFEQFRSGLLRHIGIEEKILLPAARRRQGQALPLAAVLRIEHAALASLMVPTPDRALVGEIARLLVRHNEREEGPGGVYAQCAALIGDEADALLARARMTTTPPLAAHFDGPGAHRTAAAALAAAERSAARRRTSR